MQLVAGGWLISVCIDSFESGWLSSSEGGLALIADGEATAVQLLAGGWLIVGITKTCLDVQSSVATGSFPTHSSGCSGEVKSLGTGDTAAIAVDGCVSLQEDHLHLRLKLLRWAKVRPSL